MGYKSWFFIFLLILANSLSASLSLAQTVPPGFIHKVWTVDDGLPINTLNDITVTADGFVWMSTNNGMVRFDGLTHSEGDLFKVFNKGNIKEVNSNISLRIVEINDSEYLALQPPNGNRQAAFWYKNRELKSIPFEEGVMVSHWRGNMDKTGKFYALDDGKVYSFINGIWKNEFPALELNVERGSDIQAINNDDIWILSNKGGQLFQVEKGTVKQVGKEQGLSTDNIHSFLISENEKIWVATENGIEIIEKGAGRLIHPKTWESTIGLHALEEDPGMEERIIFRSGTQDDGDVYAITESDIQILHRSLPEGDYSKDEKVSLITVEGKENKDTGWLRANKVLFYDGKPLMEFPISIRNSKRDNIGGIWVIANGQLHYLKKGSIESYTKSDFDIENAYTIMEDHEGVIWAGLLLAHVARKQNEKFEKVTEFDAIGSGRAFSVLEDSEHNIWYGSLNGVFFWDRITEAKKIETGSSLRSVRGLLEDKTGTIWVGSVHSINSYSKKHGWQEYEVIDHEGRIDVRFVYEDLDGTVWFGSNNLGLLYYDENEQVIRKFKGNKLLLDQSIRTLYQDEDGVYWVGSNGYGLVRMQLNADKNIEEVSYYNHTNGLHGQVIHAILEDDFGRLWMSSNTGVFWVSKSELESFSKGDVEKIHSTVYTKNEGLPGIEGNGGTQSPGIKTKDGSILFSMIKGIAVIYPDRINETLREVKTRISSLVTSDSNYSPLKEEVVLTKEERNLQFNYAAYNLELASNNIRYRYKLEGYDTDWIDAETRKEIFYTNVPGGEYNFVVQASLFGFDWSENQSELAFSITRYFYETFWFKLLMILGFIIILYSGFRWRIRASEKRAIELTKLVEVQTSQLTEQAKRLIELDETKSKFFANVSHEFRTPLTLIIGPLEDLKRKFQREPKSRESRNMNIALHSSKRLLKLVNQVLDISKLESNAVALSVKKVSIAQLLEHLCVAFSSVAERNNITLNQRFDGNDATIYADPEMMEKVFVNILSNAFKFTPEHGEITVSLEETETGITAKLEDTGEGIEESDLEHVFDRFYQTNESAKINQVGTGIGLALVKELVEIHSGSIHVESEPGKGSCFVVKFLKGKGHFSSLVNIEESTFKPLEFISGVTEDLKNPEIFEAIEPVLPTPDEDRATVLLVEDNEDIRAYLSQHLSEQYRVLEAENGEKGLEVAGKELPDVVISDVMMPIMDGHAFSRKLRSNPETDFIPVMLLTAKAEHSDVLSGLEIGVEDYIIKPFNIEEVKLRVRNLLESRKTLTDRLVSGGYSFKASGIKVKSEDIQFLEHIQHLIQENLSDEYFGVEELAQAAAMSRVTLNNKMKSVLNKTPREVIREFRLQSAEQLLKQKAGNISEVAYSVGFKSISQFSRAFKEEYQVSPRTFLAKRSSDS